ncbi:MAG: MBL fold metallo-hydrolase [Thiogranum sp.]
MPRCPTTRTQVLLPLFALCLLLPGIAASTELPAAQKIAAHSHAWIGPYGPPTKENGGFRMNLGFVVGNDAVAVIDSGYGDSMADSMLAQIRRVTDRPVRYVINTNSQPHRILGNAVFRKQGATIVASADAARRITADGPAMASTAEGILDLPKGSTSAPGTPDRTLAESTELDLGGTTLKIVPVGHAHTPGSLIVEVLEDKVVYAGDVLYGGRLLAVLPVSSVDGWIRAFDTLRTYAQARFVPGHGNPGSLADFEHSTYEYLSTLKSHMDDAVDQGLGLQDAIDSLDQSAWSKLADFDALAGRNAHQVYLEREAAMFE